MKILRCPKCDTFTNWAMAEVIIEASVRINETGGFYLDLDNDDLEVLSGSSVENVKPKCPECDVLYQIVERSEAYLEHLWQQRE
jgi:phage FluMu protein Com